VNLEQNTDNALSYRCHSRHNSRGPTQACFTLPCRRWHSDVTGLEIRCPRYLHLVSTWPQEFDQPSRRQRADLPCGTLLARLIAERKHSRIGHSSRRSSEISRRPKPSPRGVPLRRLLLEEHGPWPVKELHSRVDIAFRSTESGQSRRCAWRGRINVKCFSGGPYPLMSVFGVAFKEDTRVVG